MKFLMLCLWPILNQGKYLRPHKYLVPNIPLCTCRLKFHEDLVNVEILGNFFLILEACLCLACWLFFLTPSELLENISTNISGHVHVKKPVEKTSGLNRWLVKINQWLEKN